MSSWLDNVALSGENGNGVKRTMWNDDRPLTFIDDGLLGFEVRYEFRIAMYEQVVEKVNRIFWMKEGEIDWVRRFVTAQLPWKSKDDESAKELEVMYKEPEEAMGERERKQRLPGRLYFLLRLRDESTNCTTRHRRD